MKKMQLAVALGFVFAGVSYGQLVSGGGTAVDADPSIEVPIFETRQSVGGDVGGGRLFKAFVLPISLGEVHDRIINQNIVSLYEDRTLSGSIENFRVENFLSNRTEIVYFRIDAGTNENIAATDVKFRVYGNDPKKMWDESIGWTAAQGYSTETFIGERPDGQLYATGTPLTFPSRVIVGGFKLKYLPSDASSEDVDYVKWYTYAVPGMTLRITPEIKGTTYPDIVLRKAPPGLSITRVGNVVHIKAEVISDTYGYMLQGSADLVSWQDVKTLSQGGEVHITIGTEPARFYRLAYKP